MTANISPLNNLEPENPKSYKTYFAEWCHVTGWHGVIDFYTTKNVIAKLLWLAVLLLSCFLAVNQSASLIMDYVSDSHWVTSINFVMPEGGGLFWPNISVCSLDLMDQRKMLSTMNETDPYIIGLIAQPWSRFADFHHKYQEERSDAQGNETWLNASVNKVYELYDRALIGHLQNNSFTEIMKAFVRSCSDTVLHCGQSDQFFLHEKASNCCEKSRLSTEGRCFTTLPGKSFGKSYKNTGFDSGVYYLFNPRLHDYYKYILETWKPSGGLQLNLYYSNEDETAPATVLLSPGTHTLVSLVPEKHVTVSRRLHTIQFFTASAKCLENYEYDYVVPSFPHYSKRLCNADCMASWSSIVCGCIILDIPLKRGVRCKGADLIGCLGQLTLFKQENNMSLHKVHENGFTLYNCYQKCTDACNYTTLETKVSNAQFPAPVKLTSFTTYLNRAFADQNITYTEEDVKQLILFEMFYESREYKLIERVTRTSLEELVSNIGGTLGVWTGISLLSIIEALIYLTKWACFSICETVQKMVASRIAHQYNFYS